MKILAIAFLASAASALGSDPSAKFDSVTIVGKSYKNATITLESRISAKIVHDDGITKVRVIDLPDSAREKVSPKISGDPPKPEVISLKGASIDSVKFQSALSLARANESKDWVTREVSVIQTIPGGLLVMLPDSLDVFILWGDVEKRADGDKFSAPMVDTGKMQSYTSVLGAQKNVRVFMEKRPMGAGNLIAALESGKQIRVTSGKVHVACDTCKGEPVTCDACESTGVKSVDAEAVITW